jgi:glycosyltransferase involved in cell wall biosynthesis
LSAPQTSDSPQGGAKFPHGISLLAWGYNEEILIDDFFTRAQSLMEGVAADYEIVFVNDGSTDRTGELADAHARRNPRIRVIHHARNLNVGLACRTAVANARKDHLLWQTVDWSYDLTHLDIFLALLEYYDVVQGVRPVPIRLLSYIPVIRSIYRVRTRSDNFRKAIVSLGNYYLLRILFGAPFQDFQNVTIYSAKLVQGFKMRGKTSFVNPEFLIRSYVAGNRFIEVPIPFIRRSHGKAKGTKLRTILRSVVDIATNWLVWGLWLRLTGIMGRSDSRIDRVSMPFALSEPVLRLCVPLFAEFARKEEPIDPPETADVRPVDTASL